MLRRLERAHMVQPAKPTVVYHTDWSCRDDKWWSALTAAEITDFRWHDFTLFAPHEPLIETEKYIEQLRYSPLPFSSTNRHDRSGPAPMRTFSKLRFPNLVIESARVFFRT